MTFVYLGQNEKYRVQLNIYQVQWFFFVLTGFRLEIDILSDFAIKIVVWDKV